MKFYIASDYAGVSGGKFSFYFGYEITDDANDEWCFQAKDLNVEIMRIPHSQLKGNPSVYECHECLLAGIAMWLEKTK